MGMPVRLLLYAEDEEKATEAARAAYDRIQLLNTILSDYEDDSELTLLSATSGKDQWVPVSGELWRLLQAAQKLSTQSQGAFDITVGPYVQLWRKARRDHQFPKAERLAEARKAVGYEKVELDTARRAVRLSAPKMKLDLGAIAKGYALDQALAVLRRRGFDRALAVAGGDMVAGEAPPDRPGWRVELESLGEPAPTVKPLLFLRNGALATSGDLIQRVEIDGRRYSHIVDPHTGLGLTNHTLVHVLAPTCMEADALSTAVSVLGAPQGLTLLRSRRAEGRVARRSGGTVEVIASPGFARHLDQSQRNEPSRVR